MRDGFHPRLLLGGVWFIYIACNLASYIVPVFLLAMIKLIVPIRKIRGLCYRIMAGLYRAAVAGNVFLLSKILGQQMDVTDLDGIQFDKTVIVIVNHQSWIDIGLVQNLLHRRAPIPKFIAKRQVLYIPLVGLICWAYEYPLVHRFSKEYIERNQEKAGLDIQMLQDHFSRPDLSEASIILFAEGTRRTRAKAARQKSPYSHLLKPKSGGLTHLIQALGPESEEILDLTIVYDAPSPVFWNVLAGRCRNIVVEAKKVRLTDWFETDEKGNYIVDREQVKAKLDDLWREKDELIDRIKSNFDK